MNKIVRIFQENNGYARMFELKKAGISTRNIAQAVESEIIHKVKPGLYKLIDYQWDEHSSFADICNANKKAVVCLLSAASYYELTSFNPQDVYVAVPSNTDKFVIKYPPLRVYYFTKRLYESGIEIITTNSGQVKIYNKEKTVCDLFRYINKLGEDVAIESLKEYLRNNGRRTIPNLLEYADICGVRGKIEPVIKVIL
ncbi:MAG: hypothetical protein V1773_14580 [bacterium]